MGGILRERGRERERERERELRRKTCLHVTCTSVHVHLSIHIHCVYYVRQMKVRAVEYDIVYMYNFATHLERSHMKSRPALLYKLYMYIHEERLIISIICIQLFITFSYIIIYQSRERERESYVGYTVYSNCLQDFVGRYVGNGGTCAFLAAASGANPEAPGRKLTMN